MILGFQIILKSNCSKMSFGKRSVCIVVKMPKLKLQMLEDSSNQISKMKLDSKLLQPLFLSMKTTYWLKQRVLFSEMHACRNGFSLHAFFLTFKTFVVCIWLNTQKWTQQLRNVAIWSLLCCCGVNSNQI
jgi:hypothetical protein